MSGLTSDPDGDLLWYQADVSAWLPESPPYDRYFYPTLTTTGGLVLADEYNCAASVHSNSANSSSTSYGDVSFYPAGIPDE